MTTFDHIMILIFLIHCFYVCYDNLRQMRERRKTFRMLNEKKECLERMREEIKNLKK